MEMEIDNSFQKRDW